MVGIDTPTTLPGCRQERFIPLLVCGRRLSFTQRSSASRQGYGRLSGNLTPLLKARSGGYSGFVAPELAVHRGNAG